MVAWIVTRSRMDMDVIVTRSRRSAEWIELKARSTGFVVHWLVGWTALVGVPAVLQDGGQQRIKLCLRAFERLAFLDVNDVSYWILFALLIACGL